MSRPKIWPAVRASGCRRREFDFDWDLVRQCVQAAARAQAVWTSFVDAFWMADAFCGRSQGQKLVRKACKSTWCDTFSRGSHEMQSWRRKARICKHILTARQRLDEWLSG